MAFCSSCGGKIDDDAKFCPSCGGAVGGKKIETTASVPQSQSAGIQTMTIMADEKFCFSCGSAIKKAADICPKCGVDQNNRGGIAAIDMYCTSCGKTIKKAAAVCPFCGVRQDAATERNWKTALLLLIFTGFAHRFYVGKIGTGILMLLLFVIGVSCTTAIIVGELFYDGLPLLMVFYAAFIIWWIIDLVNICTRKFKDEKSNPLK